jgi:F-type H+-transporting ATPase subunit beta
MDTTEGLVRGQSVSNTGSPIQIPVGRATLGRIMNVIGEPIDECGPIETSSSLAIHREAPPFVDQSTEMEMLITGIKVNRQATLTMKPYISYVLHPPGG